jgi:hypothetical protein
MSQGSSLSLSFAFSSSQLVLQNASYSSSQGLFRESVQLPLESLLHLLHVGLTLFLHLFVFNTLRLEPRRAAVAIIIRVVPSPSCPPPPAPTTQPTLSEFFEFDWVNDPGARPEILFLRRENLSQDDSTFIDTKPRNTKEAHVAFPGGRMEEGDEGGLYTGSSRYLLSFPRLFIPPLAMRQTWEEIALDLAERDYTCVGQLDDREITTSLGKRLLMILSPFVFLQLTPHSLPTDPLPSTTLHWTPLSSFVSSSPPKWSTVTVDAASRLAPKHSTALRLLVRVLVGSMQFPAIIVEPSSLPSDSKPSFTHDYEEKGIPASIHAGHSSRQSLKLWGLSLGMTLDLMSYMVAPPASNSNPSSIKTPPISPVLQLPYQSDTEMRVDVVAPSLASVFPRFSYPDVNFWIWSVLKKFLAFTI